MADLDWYKLTSSRLRKMQYDLLEMEELQGGRLGVRYGEWIKAKNKTSYATESAIIRKDELKQKINKAEAEILIFEIRVSGRFGDKARTILVEAFKNGLSGPQIQAKTGIKISEIYKLRKLLIDNLGAEKC